MKQKIEEKLRAVALRSKGYSVNEIVANIGVAKSSVSVWVRNVPMGDKQRLRLLTKITLGQLKSAENKRQRTKDLLSDYRNEAERKLKKINLESFDLFICALMYWCEGAKDLSHGINFINSDPRVIKSFLTLLRKSFSLDESKFRVLVHLHEYHNERKQIDFWSNITNIKKSQFIKSYQKPHTGKRIRENYQGCAAVRYHSNDLAKRLLSTAQVFLNKYGPIV